MSIVNGVAAIVSFSVVIPAREIGGVSVVADVKKHPSCLRQRWASDVTEDSCIENHKARTPREFYELPHCSRRSVETGI